MILYLIALALLCLWGVRFSGFREDYISKEQTGSFKGFFVMMIFFSHIQAYLPVDFFGDKIVTAVYGVLGQLIVVVFLFYSGYGVMESIRNKPGYMKGFFKNRIVKLILDYNIVSLAYMLYRTCTGTFFSWERYAFSWCGWETVEKVEANGNWFIFAVLSLYMITWLINFLLHRILHLEGMKFQYILTASVILVTVGLMWLLGYVGRPDFWYNILITYGFGMLYSVLRKPIEDAMRKTPWYLMALAITGGAMGVLILLRLNDIVSFSVLACLFAFFLVLVSMRVRIQNPVLIWLGKLSFSIYLVHKGCMAVFQGLGFAENPILYGALCIVSTMIMAQLHHWVAGKLTGAILKKKQTVQK